MGVMIGGKVKCPEVPLIVRCAGRCPRYIHRTTRLVRIRSAIKAGPSRNGELDEDEIGIGNSCGGGAGCNSGVRGTCDGGRHVCRAWKPGIWRQYDTDGKR